MKKIKLTNKGKKLFTGLIIAGMAVTGVNIAANQPDEAVAVDTFDMWVVNHTYEDGCKDVQNSRTGEYKFYCDGVYYDELQPVD